MSLVVTQYCLECSEYNRTTRIMATALTASEATSTTVILSSNALPTADESKTFSEPEINSMTNRKATEEQSNLSTMVTSMTSQESILEPTPVSNTLWTTIIIVILVGVIILLTVIVYCKSKKDLQMWWSKHKILRNTSMNKDNGNPIRPHNISNEFAAYETIDTNEKVTADNILYSQSNGSQTEKIGCNIELSRDFESKSNEQLQCVYDQII